MRSEQIRRDNDIVKIQSKHLVDIDTAVQQYLEQKILLNISDSNKNIVPVPVKYATPELWASVQSSGFLRDTKTNKIRVPVLAFRRSNISRDREKIKNLDANKSMIHKVYEKQYTKANRYDRFSITNNIVPKKELYSIIIPDFVTVEYNCKVWTDYITHMNQIIEAINYADSAYWGETDKFKFYTNVGDFGEIEEISTAEGRGVFCEFNLSVKAHIISSNVQKEINNQTKSFSVGSISISFKEQD